LFSGEELSALQAITSWLDRPLSNWNAAGGPVPRAPASEEPVSEIVRRCRLTPPQSSSPGERAIAASGWIPFHYFGEPLVFGDVEVVGGMAAADGMCRPVTYNVFVFAGGRFGGVLSPDVMTSRLDGSSGPATLSADGIVLEFARYVPSDPLCCPSARVTVRYRIDRTGGGPVVIPLSIAPPGSR
jgi:hypothetical protein